MIEPIDKDNSIVKPHSLPRKTSHQELTDSPLSKYEKYDVTGKVTEGISLKNSSVFSEAGKKSLSESFSRDYS